MSENIKSICSDEITYRSNVKKQYNNPTNIAFISFAAFVLEPFSFVGPKQLHQWLHFGMLKYSTSLHVLMECFKANIMEEATTPQKVKKWNFFQEASLWAKWCGHCSLTEEKLAFRKECCNHLVATRYHNLGEKSSQREDILSYIRFYTRCNCKLQIKFQKRNWIPHRNIIR